MRKILTGAKLLLMSITQWELYVAMETRVLIGPGPKPDATFPLLNDASDKI